MATMSQKSASATSSSAGEFSRGKTIFVLAVVIGCFAILWPKIFYPMLTASLGGGDDDQQCCNVISEEDADFHKVIEELCGVIKKRDGDGTLKKDPIVIKEPLINTNTNINVNTTVNVNATELLSNSSTSTNQSTPIPPPQSLSQKPTQQQQKQQKQPQPQQVTEVPKGYNKYRSLYVGPGALCRNEVLRTCGIDILALVKNENDKDALVITKDYVETLNKIRSYNVTACIKEEYGVQIGFHRRFKTAGSSNPSIRQERPIHFHRPELMHPALREKGNTIAPSSFSAPPPQRTLEKEARPGPFPGVRPPVGGAGYQAAPPKGGGTMGIIMPLYTIAIVVFFVYTIMKILFRKNEDKPLPPPIQPMVKDYGMDPNHRKFVLSEEYAPGADRSLKDSYNKEDRDAGIRRRSSTGKKFQEQKSRLDKNSPESEQETNKESEAGPENEQQDIELHSSLKPVQTEAPVSVVEKFPEDLKLEKVLVKEKRMSVSSTAEGEEPIHLFSALKPVQTESVMSVEQKFPEQVKLEKVLVKEKRPSISSSSAPSELNNKNTEPEPESEPVELYSKLNPMQTEVSLAIEEKFPQNVKLEKVIVKEKRPSISTPSEQIELYSELKPVQTEKPISVDEKYPQNVALEKIQVSQKDLTPNQLKRLSISEPPKELIQQQQEKEAEEVKQPEQKPQVETKGSLMENTDSSTDLTEVTDLIDSGSSADMTIIQDHDDVEYGDGEDPELTSLALTSPMSSKFDEDLDLLTSSVDLPSLSLAGNTGATTTTTIDTDKLISDISLMDKLKLDDLNLNLNLLVNDSGMRDRDAIVTALRGIIEATLVAADKHQQTQEKTETNKDSQSNSNSNTATTTSTSTTKTKGGDQQTDKKKKTKTKTQNNYNKENEEEELTNLHTTRLNPTHDNDNDNDNNIDNMTPTTNVSTSKTKTAITTTATSTTPVMSTLKNKHNTHTKKSKFKSQIEHFYTAHVENDIDNNNEYNYGNDNDKNVRTETNKKKKRKRKESTHFSITTNNSTLNKTSRNEHENDNDNANDKSNKHGNKSQPPTESETTSTTTTSTTVLDAPNTTQELSQPVKATPIQISTEEAQSQPDAKKPQEEEKPAQPEPKTSVQSTEATQPSKSQSGEPEVEKRVKILDIPTTLGGNSTEVTEDEDEEEDERIVQEILRREAEEQHTEEEEEEEEESLPPRPPTPPKSKQPRKSSDSSQAISNYADTLSNRVVRLATETAATVLSFENSKAEKAKEAEAVVAKPQLSKTGGVSVVNLEETIEMENGHKMRSPTPPNVRPTSMSPIPPQQQAPAVELEKEEIPSIVLQGTMPPLARQVLVSELSSSRDELRNLDSPGKGETQQQSDVESEEEEEEEEAELDEPESVSAPVVLSGKVTLSVIAGGPDDQPTDATSISQDQAQAQALEAEAEKTGTIKRNPQASKLTIDEDGVLDGDDGITHYKTAELAEFVGDEREETAEDVSALEDDILASDEDEDEVDEEEEEEDVESEEEEEEEENDQNEKR